MIRARRKFCLLALTVLVLWAICITEFPVEAAPIAPSRLTVRGAQVVDEQGQPVFLAGVNYEGFTDRAWKMWEDGQFDPTLIQRDFETARLGGYNTLRVFVQEGLATNILAGDFSKLDKVVALAKKQGLRLLLTLADYGEPRLENLLILDRLVAAHYRDEPTIFAFDLKNEPNFGDFAGIVYPGGEKPALQTDVLLQAYGERISREAVKSWRYSDEGKRVVSVLQDDETAWHLANGYKLWQEFEAEAGSWGQPGVTVQPGTVTSLLVAPGAGRAGFGYGVSNEGRAKWGKLIEAVDGTLSRWTELRAEALRQAAPQTLLTIGFNDMSLAILPGPNRYLDFISPHIYGYLSDLAGTYLSLETLRSFYPVRPIVFEEFGYSGVQWPSAPVDSEVVAGYETAVWLWLRQHDFAGGYKWLLNSPTNNPNHYEAGFGLLDSDNKPNPNFLAARAVLDHGGSRGEFTRLEIGPDGKALEYEWHSAGIPTATLAQPQEWFGNGTLWREAEANWKLLVVQAGQAPWHIGWQKLATGETNLSLSTNNMAWVWLDLKGLNGGKAVQVVNATVQTDPLSADTTAFQPQLQPDGSLALLTQPGATYLLKLAV